MSKSEYKRSSALTNLSRVGWPAEYGKRLLPTLAETLIAEFGKGFYAPNFRYMRLLYQAFPICDALRHELSWTHFRALLRVESAQTREWYINEQLAKDGRPAPWRQRQYSKRPHDASQRSRASIVLIAAPVFSMDSAGGLTESVKGGKTGVTADS